MGLENLKHVKRELKNGGRVIVLDTGAVITPEGEAMLQALHSRSIGGIFHHLEVLAKKGVEKFISTFYTGYGHKSIGDCGSATLFIEGVSMLVPKAIQDWPLYNGQESSTRYIDFAQQPFLNPLGTAGGARIQDDWRKFYLYGLKQLQESLVSRFPQQPGEDATTYTKAINARAFDIMRAFLPAGATTNLSAHMELRQFADEILILRHHPLEEVREVASAMEDALMEMFPSSFSKKRYEATEEYNASIVPAYTYFNNPQPEEFNLSNISIDLELLNYYKKALQTRPPKTELPKKIRECGNARFDFMLDFGSFRDIQRQRAVVQQMPLLTTKHGFHRWYMEETAHAGKTMYHLVDNILDDQTKAIEKLDCSPEIKQYYIGMGFNTTNRVTGDLHALTYLVELRSSQTVHPTLRERAIQMGSRLLRHLEPNGLVLHMDSTPTRFEIKRGTHDITFK